jgi:hypothetical protein
MTLKLAIIIGLGIAFVVGGNFIVEYFIISTAEKKVRALLQERGFRFQNFRRVGILNKGDFKEDRYELEVLGNPNGRIDLDLYRYVDFIDVSGKNRTVTLKVSWHLFKKTILQFKPDML